MVQDITPDASEALHLAQTSVQSLFRTDRASRGLGLEIIEVAHFRGRCSRLRVSTPQRDIP